MNKKYVLIDGISGEVIGLDTIDAAEAESKLQLHVELKHRPYFLFKLQAFWGGRYYSDRVRAESDIDPADADRAVRQAARIDGEEA